MPKKQITLFHPKNCVSADLVYLESEWHVINQQAQMLSGGLPKPHVQLVLHDIKPFSHACNLPGQENALLIFFN
jgi:hypothetical protein